MPAARVNGHVIHYLLENRERPSRPTLVFSNSLGTDLRVWDPLLPHLPPHWRLLRYDTAGHGLSEYPGAYSIQDHTVDLAGLLEELEIEVAVVVGLSVGGQIAQALAAAEPHRVEGLVLCDTAPRIGEAAIWEQRIDGVRRTGLAAMSAAVLERWFTQDFREHRPDELALWRAMLERTPAESYTALCAALRDTDLSASTARIAKPTLCVVGAEDGSTPPELVRAMAETIEGARFEVIPGAGHLPCVEAPQQLASLIVDFMKESQLA